MEDNEEPIREDGKDEDNVGINSRDVGHNLYILAHQVFIVSYWLQQTSSSHLLLLRDHILVGPNRCLQCIETEMMLLC